MPDNAGEIEDFRNKLEVLMGKYNKKGLRWCNVQEVLLEKAMQIAMRMDIKADLNGSS